MLIDVYVDVHVQVNTDKASVDVDEAGRAESPDLLGFLDDFELSQTPAATAARFAQQHM